MDTQMLEPPEVVSGRFVEGMPEEEYHAHPALSASGMKDLLRSPKYFRLQRSMNKAKKEFDEGHAMITGAKAPVRVEVAASVQELNEIANELIAAEGSRDLEADIFDLDEIEAEVVEED